MNSSAQQTAEEFANSVNNLQDLQKTTNTTSRPNHPAGYVRAKIGHKALLVKCLIDSGNLFGNLISENLAKTLRVRYKGVEKTVGTAANDGALTILGRAIIPIRLYLEDVRQSVTIKPYVVRSLSHPINLGQQFLSDNEADMTFREKGHSILLKIKGSATCLTTGKASLARPTIDHRIKMVLDAHQERGGNPLCSPEDTVLDLRINSLGEEPELPPDPPDAEIPGINHAPSKEPLEWSNTKIRIHNIRSHTIPGNSTVAIEAALGKFGEKIAHPPVSGPIMMFPKQTNRLLNKKEVLVHPGVYQQGNTTTRLLVTNVSNEAVTLPPGLNLGHITHAQSSHLPAVNTLDHRDPAELTEAELKERREYIIKALKLDENAMCKESAYVKEEIITIFLENWDAVSINDADYGCTKLMQYSIELQPGTTPFRSKLRPLNPLQENDLRRQIDDWLEAGVVEPSNSAWSSALVPVKKKGTDKLRWAIDYRRLNEVTLKDSYPLANIETNLHKLAKSQVFSTLDSAGAFHSMVIRPQDRDYTAFVTPFGQYRFCRLPFGLANAPSAYSRLVQIALDRLPRNPAFTIAFIDDIICHSITVEEHLDHLRQVVELHASVGMKLNLNKCSVVRKEVEYLGHMVSAEGISMVPSYVERINDWSLPGTGKELASFLGFTGYYRMFIPEYSRLTAEMNKMKKDKELQWDEKGKANFAKLKELFNHQPVRGYPLYDSPEPFVLDSDWSHVNMACVLSQKQEGKEKFLGCVAKKCNEAESNYPSHKGELAAVILGLRKFEHILRAKEFIIQTDSRCVEFLHGIKEQRGIYARWNNFLSSFNFKTEHRAGSKQINADSLSRRQDIAPEEEMPDPNEPLHDAADIYAVDPEIKVRGLTMDQLRAATAKDRVLSLMYTYVHDKHKPDAQERKTLGEVGMTYAQNFESLEAQDGLLYYRGPCLNGIIPAKRICLPQVYYDLAYTMAHKDPSGISGHSGILSTWRKMRKVVYFPHMYIYITGRVNNCVECVKKRPHLPKAKHVPYTEELSYISQRIYCDVVGPVTPAVYERQTVKQILTIQDGFSRYLVAVPIPDCTTKTVVDRIITHWVLKFGLFETLHTDQGTCYTSGLFKEVMNKLGIVHTVTPPYSPEANRVERAHQCLGNLLRSDNRLEGSNWPQKLPYACMAYNTTINRITGVSPFEAMFGRNPILPLDLIFPFKHPSQVTFSEHIASMRQRFSDICEKVVLNTKSAIARKNANYQGRKPPPFQVGDVVYYFLTRVRPGLSRKLTLRWIGPFTVKKVVSDSLYVIYPAGKWSKNDREIAALANRLRKVEDDTLFQVVRPPDNQQINLDDLSEEIDEGAEIICYGNTGDKERETPPVPPPVTLPDTHATGYSQPTNVEQARENIDPTQGSDLDPCEETRRAPCEPKWAPLPSPPSPLHLEGMDNEEVSGSPEGNAEYYPQTSGSAESPGCARARPFGPSQPKAPTRMRQAAATARANIAQQVRNPFGRKTYTRQEDGDLDPVNMVIGYKCDNSLPKREYNAQNPILWRSAATWDLRQLAGPIRASLAQTCGPMRREHSASPSHKHYSVGKYTRTEQQGVENTRVNVAPTGPKLIWDQSWGSWASLL